MLRKSKISVVAMSRLLATVGLLCVSITYGADPENTASEAAVRKYRDTIQPILTSYCYDCHGDGADEGGMQLDGVSDDRQLVGNRQLWWAVLKNLRAGIMPPPDQDRPAEQDRKLVTDWITVDVFGVDPDNPDPGRVTVRRLNRVEYRNTIRDLMGVDFDAQIVFPPDDTGFGFDNVGDALGLSPLLMEKYLQSAQWIVDRAVPSSPPTEESEAKDTQDYERFFFRDKPPTADDERRQYAKEVLSAFTRRAFRRSVNDVLLNRLVSLAEQAYRQTDATFEAGIARAMVAVLSSPRFLFRIEEVEEADPGDRFPPVDEYSLASRLSYFLWSSMPDDALLDLAERRKLRSELPKQVQRMLDDPRSQAFVSNFVGQWLRVRDVEHVSIAPLVALGHEEEWEQLQKIVGRGSHRESNDENRSNEELKELRNRYRELKDLRKLLSPDVRQAMRRETEMLFDNVMREDRSVLELIDSDYTYVNEKLARLYDIPDVRGEQMRRVSLPDDSPRGGVLTQAAVLAVTSNPTRTSPVKRGLYVLDNILGTPSAPPPPNIPRLEEAAEKFGDRQPTQRELMALHRESAMCSSCHARMDPLGLALENFNALGMWRDTENGQPIDASGELITGETFQDVRDLKKILVTQRRTDFYRCMTQKLMTYALGRGLEYYDEYVVDKIVEQLDESDGRFSVLLTGVLESAPFQRRRVSDEHVPIEYASKASSIAKGEKP